jgi:hypothetical protein
MFLTMTQSQDVLGVFNTLIFNSTCLYSSLGSEPLTLYCSVHSLSQRLVFKFKKSIILQNTIESNCTNGTLLTWYGAYQFDRYVIPHFSLIYNLRNCLCYKYVLDNQNWQNWLIRNLGVPDNGSRSNRPQTKSAPSQIGPSQIGPKSNRPQIKSLYYYGFFHTNYISIIYYKPLSLSVYKHIIIQKSYDLYKIHSQCYTYIIQTQ